MGSLENGKTGGAEGEGRSERVIAASRRPDGSLRKEIRIRAGYTPQDEVAIYQPKGAQFKKGTDVPPGYDPDSAAKPKTKAAKKNEKRKEKKQQSATTISPNPTGEEEVNVSTSQVSPVSNEASTLANQLSSLKVTATPETQQERDGSGNIELEKRIRALRKKIRLTDSKQNATTAEQAEKLAKLESWRQELQGLEALLPSA